jgi:hypothetical protein
MTASVAIAGNLRTIPDADSVPLINSGVQAHANFRSVLEQYHASPESGSDTDDNHGSSQHKQKDSDPSTTLAVPQPVTPAVEAPRLILPFTTSITLRQDADEKVAQDATTSPDDTATQDSTPAADSNPLPSVIANTLPAPVILRSTLDLRSLPRVSDMKAESAPVGEHPKTQAKGRAKHKDSVLPQTTAAPLEETAPADPSIPIRPVTSPTTLEQATTVVQNSSTVSEVPYTVSRSTADRAIAYQDRSSNERPTSRDAVNRSSQEPQKVSDPTPAAAPTVPVPAVNTVGSTTPRRDVKALESIPRVPQDTSIASGTDSRSTMPPAAEGSDDNAAASHAGEIAFAARLTPTADVPTPASESIRPAEPMPSSQTPLQLAAPIAAKQIATGADVPADTHTGEGSSQSDKEKAGDLFAKPDALLSQMHAGVAGQTTMTEQTVISANPHASATPLPVAAQMGQVVDPPAVASKTNNDITVRIPDATGQDTAVRFVERAGEIHVSVRTSDVEMAQSLRGGLNDLVNHLEDGGIRTEVWQPGTGSNTSTSQKDSHQPFADPDGPNGRQYSSGSNAEQESEKQNRPRWVEELEGSIGNPNFKETTQLWQA